MTHRRKAIGTTIIAVAVVIVVMASTIAFVILTSQSVPSPITSSSSFSTGSSPTTEGPIVVYSPISTSGLQVQVALNSTTITSHGAVAAQIEVLNTLNHNVSLPVAPNQNISTWNGDDFFCGRNPSDSLVGFALFKGYFPGNLSAAESPLQLAAPIAVPCPYSLPLNDTTFLPNSDKTISLSYYGQTEEPSYPVTAEVNATTNYCVSSPGSDSCPTSSGILGYWNPGFGYTGNMTYTSKDFTYLPSGAYTIVAKDDWNQTVHAYFWVVSATSSSSNSSYTISNIPTQTLTYECSITGQPGGLFFRIISDSNQTPIAGATIKATNQPAYCNNSPANEQATSSFTTSAGTRWYSFDTENDAGYSFVVTYLGQTYTLQANLRPLSVTCATLYVPSGRTNMTITEFQTSC